MATNDDLFADSCFSRKLNSIVKAQGCDLVRQVEGITVIEGHVVPIASKYHQVILEDDTRVAVSGSRPLALHMENLGILVPANHWRAAIHVSHGSAH